MDQTSQIQTGSSSQDYPQKLRKKKSPSVRKRDSLRMEKHLRNKRNATPQANTPSSKKSTPPTELNQEVVIRESPLISNNAEDMDTAEETVPENKPKDKLITQETVNEPALETRNSVAVNLQTKDIADPGPETSDINSEMIDAALTQMETPLIMLAINSPKQGQPPINKEQLQKKEIHFLICASDQAGAKK